MYVYNPFTSLLFVNEEEKGITEFGDSDLKNPERQAPDWIEMFRLTHTCQDGQPVDRVGGSNGILKLFSFLFFSHII